MFFNYRLPNNHKLYNSSLNDKHINVIENNKIVKKRKQKKLMKAYHDEVNLMSYNKKDLILNTWNKLLNSENITEEESNIVKQSIEELKNSNEEFE